MSASRKAAPGGTTRKLYLVASTPGLLMRMYYLRCGLAVTVCLYPLSRYTYPVYDPGKRTHQGGPPFNINRDVGASNF